MRRKKNSHSANVHSSEFLTLDFFSVCGCLLWTVFESCQVSFLLLRHQVSLRRSGGTEAARRGGYEGCSAARARAGEQPARPWREELPEGQGGLRRISATQETAEVGKINSWTKDEPAQAVGEGELCVRDLDCVLPSFSFCVPSFRRELVQLGSCSRLKSRV